MGPRGPERVCGCGQIPPSPGTRPRHVPSRVSVFQSLKWVRSPFPSGADPGAQGRVGSPAQLLALWGWGGGGRGWSGAVPCPLLASRMSLVAGGPAGDTRWPHEGHSVRLLVGRCPARAACRTTLLGVALLACRSPGTAPQHLQRRLAQERAPTPGLLPGAQASRECCQLVAQTHGGAEGTETDWAGVTLEGQGDRGSSGGPGEQSPEMSEAGESGWGSGLPDAPQSLDSPTETSVTGGRGGAADARRTRVGHSELSFVGTDVVSSASGKARGS